LPIFAAEILLSSLCAPAVPILTVMMQSCCQSR